MKRSKIAVFDSGVGGITLLHRLIQMMPRENYLYYADSANTPYGDRSSLEVEGLFEAAISAISQQNLKAIVVACNTISMESINDMRSQCDIPIIEMQPAVKPPLMEHDPRKILIIGTSLTLKRSKFERLISNLQNEDVVEAKSMQELVDFAEEFEFDSPDVKRYLRQEFQSINWESYHSLVLGCTHFLYFKQLIEEFIPGDIHVIDGHGVTAQKVRSMIQQEHTGKSHSLECQLSGKEVATEIIMPYLNLVDRSYSPLDYWKYK